MKTKVVLLHLFAAIAAAGLYAQAPAGGGGTGAGSQPAGGTMRPGQINPGQQGQITPGQPGRPTQPGTPPGGFPPRQPMNQPRIAAPGLTNISGGNQIGVGSNIFGIEADPFGRGTNNLLGASNIFGIGA